MGSISIREHIRWGSDPALEPTSTLVLTSPGRRFVDIRPLKTALAERAADTSDKIPASLKRDQLDWAFAGTSTSTQVTRNDGSQVSHSTFRHWVDSRTKQPEEVVDEGDMIPREDGTTLETGRMVNPATGTETEYEELWRDEEPLPVEGLARCTVFQIHEDDVQKRGLFLQLGQYAQGVLRDGDMFTVERWAWKGPLPRWERLVKAGDADAPSLGALLDTGRRDREGDAVEIIGGVWTVIETNA